VLRVPETAVLPPPKYVAGLAAEFIRGIVRLDGRLIVLVDMDRILGSEERIALQAAFASGEGGASDPAVSGGSAGSATVEEIDPGEVNAVPAAMMEGDAGSAPAKGRTRKG